MSTIGCEGQQCDGPLIRLKLDAFVPSWLDPIRTQGNQIASHVKTVVSLGLLE
jgi:hypothetical protein